MAFLCKRPVNNFARLLIVIYLSTSFLQCKFFTATKDSIHSKLTSFIFQTRYNFQDKITRTHNSIITGTVSVPDKEKASILTIALKKNKDMFYPVAYTIQEQSGPFFLNVPGGSYYLLSFIDNNSNKTLDESEKASNFSTLHKINILSGDIKTNIKLIISDSLMNKTIGKITVQDLICQKRNQVKYANGAIINFEDPVFSFKNASMGYHSPQKLMKIAGIQIYLIEKYDNNKIPILFIHGASGSPLAWKFFVNNINRKKYQPLLFYYPTGFRMSPVVKILNEKIKHLINLYSFKTLYITAHSMGGLIARSYISRYYLNKKKYDYNLKFFISISTPWGGIDYIKKGVSKLPYSIPVWNDVASNSEILKQMFSSRISPPLKFCLFFSYKGNNPLNKNSNDGIVLIKSQLDLRAQNEATVINGFDEDHSSILQSKVVLEKYNTILANQ